MAKKYYAVRKGKKTGIFTTWDECKQYVHGYPSASYKSFTNKQDAEAYMQGESASIEQTNEITKVDSEVVAYVDGSFHKGKGEFSYGAVIFYQGKQFRFSQKYNDPEFVAMRNVAGEIKGAEKAMEFAMEKCAKSLTIYHDYEGIAKWCTNEWKANKSGTIAYKRYYDRIKEDIQIQFVKVKSHSGDELNDLADQLAKDAFL